MWKAARTTCFVAVMVLFASSAQAQYPDKVKFLSYNLWGYRNAEMPGGYDSLAAVINEIGADISGHQEVDRANSRSKGVDVIAYLGERTGMHSLFAPALKGWNGGDYGEGLLAKHPPLSTPTLLGGRARRRRPLGHRDRDHHGRRESAVPDHPPGP